MSKLIFMFTLGIAILINTTNIYAKQLPVHIYSYLNKSNVNTPDGLTVDSSGSILVAIPNFKNDVLLKTKKTTKTIKS